MGTSDISRPNEVESLIQALKDGDWEARRDAVRTLGELGDARAVEPLIQVVRRGNILDPRELAAAALGEIGDTSAVEPLIEVLKDFQSRARRAAADALDQLGWRPRDETEKVHLLVAREEWDELAALGEEQGVELLIHACKHVDRRELTRVFVRIGEPAVEPLIQALKHKHVLQAAVQALGIMGDARAVEPLTQVLQHEDYELQQAVAHALYDLGFRPRDDTEAAYLLTAREEWDELARLGEPAVEPLIRVLRRIGKPGATGALARIGKPAVEPLIQALEDLAAFARWQAATALGEIGDARAVGPLTQVLKDQNREIQEAAKEALEKIKAKKSQE